MFILGTIFGLIIAILVLTAEISLRKRGITPTKYIEKTMLPKQKAKIIGSTDEELSMKEKIEEADNLGIDLHLTDLM